MCEVHVKSAVLLWKTFYNFSWSNVVKWDLFICSKVCPSSLGIDWFLRYYEIYVYFSLFHKFVITSLLLQCSILIESSFFCMSFILNNILLISLLNFSGHSPNTFILVFTACIIHKHRLPFSNFVDWWEAILLMHIITIIVLLTTQFLQSLCSVFQYYCIQTLTNIWWHSPNIDWVILDLFLSYKFYVY